MCHIISYDLSNNYLIIIKIVTLETNILNELDNILYIWFQFNSETINKSFIFSVTEPGIFEYNLQKEKVFKGFFISYNFLQSLNNMDLLYLPFFINLKCIMKADWAGSRKINIIF